MKVLLSAVAELITSARCTLAGAGKLNTVFRMNMCVLSVFFPTLSSARGTFAFLPSTFFLFVVLSVHLLISPHCIEKVRKKPATLNATHTRTDKHTPYKNTVQTVRKEHFQENTFH